MKKGKISVDKYDAAFTEIIKLVPYLVPNELYKIKKFSNGLPMDFGPMVKLAATLEAAIRVSKSLKDIFKGRTIDQAEVEKKRKNKGSS